MLEETSLPEPENKTSDLLRKIAAAIVGIIVIILIVLAAKWIGDRIRARFFPSTINQTVPPEISPTPASEQNGGNLTITPGPSESSGASTIPNTGTEDYIYVIVGLMAIGGVSALALAKKRSI